MNHVSYDVLTQQKIILELPIGSSSDLESKTLFYFKNDKYKNVEQRAFETGHFLYFQAFARGFVLAGFGRFFKSEFFGFALQIYVS